MCNINTNKLTASVVLLLIALAACVVPPGAFASRLTDASESLDTFAEEKEPQAMVGTLASVLKLDKAFVEKVLLEKKYKSSELVYIKALTTKTGQTPEAVMNANAAREWTAALQKGGVKEDDVADQLDNTYADLAIQLMDQADKKGTIKKLSGKR